MIGDDDLDKPVEDYTPTLWDNEMRALRVGVNNQEPLSMIITQAVLMAVVLK